MYDQTTAFAIWSFYDNEIPAVRGKTDHGRTCVSVCTTNGAGPFHPAACLTRAKLIVGQTLPEHRDFLFTWNATRKQASSPGPFWFAFLKKGAEAFLCVV